MNRDEMAETNRAVLAAAQRQGYNLSSTQLVRWHQAGLLPRPRQQPLKDARGTCSLYPKGTSEQMLLLCSLRASNRRYYALAWQIWMLGYPVELSLIRTHLAAAALRLARWSRWLAHFKSSLQAGYVSAEALDFVEHYSTTNLQFRLLRRIRKRVGRQHFPTFLLLLAGLASPQDEEMIGASDRYEWLRDLRILAMGLGLEKRFTLKEDQLEYYLPCVLMPQLRWLLRRLQEASWGSLVEQATDFELLKARDELITWLMGAGNARLHRARLHSEYPRWGVNAQEIFRSLPMSEQELAVAGWLALRAFSPSWLADVRFLVPADFFSSYAGNRILL